MDKIDFEVNDFINYCDYKGLSTKTISSYEQTLRLFIQYLKMKCNIKETEKVTEAIITKYITSVKERGKYTILTNEYTKKINRPEHRQNYGKKVSLAIVNNYTRNMRVFFNYMYDNRLIKTNPMRKIKPIKTPRKVVGYMTIQISTDY